MRNNIKRSFTVLFMMFITWTAFSAGNMWLNASRHHQSRALSILLVAFPFIAAGMMVVFRAALMSLYARFLALCEKNTDHIDRISRAHPGFWIALAAGLGLFAELMVIRLHSSYFQLFAYFKNISLLACFLGLGIGYTQGARKPLFTPLIIPGIALQIVIMHFLKIYGGVMDMLNNPVSETFMFGVGQIAVSSQLLTVYGFITFIFIISALTFIPLGHAASYLMSKEKKLTAYGWNLAGSLAGILVFSYISFLWAPPCVWIGCFAVCILLMLTDNRSVLLASGVVTIVVVCLIAVPVKPNQVDIYSPYQPLSLKVGHDPYPTLEVSNVYFQRILNLSTANVKANPSMLIWRLYYDLPYLVKPAPEDVLIVGSGTGNDVASAVRNSAGRVDAVEIDPAIAKLGIMLHPEEPYQNNKVTLVTNDARSYIRHTKKMYDIIVYGLLDSHTLLSSRSGIRLDSYVYTVEGLRDARAHLKKDGIITLSFSTLNMVMALKLYLMLAEAFDGAEPRTFNTGYDNGITFIAGNSGMNVPNLPGNLIQENTGALKQLAFINKNEHITDLSTDNWPFFYMPKRSYPVSYANMMLLVIGVSVLMLFGFSESGSVWGFSFPCFFLGSGFMLIETKGITELALVYGSTWMVISAVIAGILIMAFLANLVIIRYGSPGKAAIYSLLALSILTGFFMPQGGFGNIPAALEQLIRTAILTLPLFFSGFAFSSQLVKEGSIGMAISSNMLGAMVGGILEYNSMFLGFRALYIFALVLYVLAFATSRTRSPR